MHNIFLIIEREFLSRVRKKSFILVTLLTPLVFLCITLLPAVIVYFSGHDLKNIVIVDASKERIGDQLKDTESIRFSNRDIPLVEALAQPDIDGILYIPENAVTTPSDIELHSNGAESVKLEQQLSEQLKEVIESKRLEKLGIKDLPSIIKQVECQVTLRTYRNDTADRDETSSSISFALGMGLSFVLYLFLLIYGQLVMNSVIEEKSNRVLEIIVTSVKPIDLMLGKILGITSVALVQVLIWMALVGAIFAVLPHLASPEIMAQVQDPSSVSSSDMITGDVVATILQTTNLSYVLGIMVSMLLFLIGGFLFYAALFAAIGSTVDNAQDIAQIQPFVIAPIVVGLMISISVATNPSSVIATIFSYIPFTSPMVMMTRIPFGVSLIELITSLLVLYGSFIGAAWMAGKIYRVGIFMYGKKPSIKDLINWLKL